MWLKDKHFILPTAYDPRALKDHISNCITEELKERIKMRAKALKVQNAGPGLSDNSKDILKKSHEGPKKKMLKLSEELKKIAKQEDAAEAQAKKEAEDKNTSANSQAAQQKKPEEVDSDSTESDPGPEHKVR